MWIQLDDDALAKAAKVLRAAGETQSADRIEFYLNDNKANADLNDKFRTAARDKLDEEDDVDGDAVVSESEDGGAYVMCWVWVRNDEAGVNAYEGEPDNVDPV